MSDEVLRYCYRKFQATSDPEWAMRFMRHYMRQIGDDGPLEPERVWTVFISHQHGEGTNVFRTSEGATDFVYAWVCEWWSEVVGYEYGPEGQYRTLDPVNTIPVPETPPADKEEAIRIYFEIKHDRETYHIEPGVEIQD